MRSGESLVAMTADRLKQIFAETGPDFTAEVCAGADLGTLDALQSQSFVIAGALRLPMLRLILCRTSNYWKTAS